LSDLFGHVVCRKSLEVAQSVGQGDRKGGKHQLCLLNGFVFGGKSVALGEDWEDIEESVRVEQVVLAIPEDAGETSEEGLEVNLLDLFAGLLVDE